MTDFLGTTGINSVNTISRPPLPPRPRRCLMVRKTLHPYHETEGTRRASPQSVARCSSGTLAPKAREAVTTTSRSHTGTESGRKRIFLYAIITSRGSD